MSKGIFITGTDTGVGKTIVSAMIIRALIKKGIKVGAMKPVETGCRRTEDRLLPSDGMFLKEMAGMDDSIDLVTPIRFENPLAPMVASEIEGIPVKLEKVFNAYKILSEKYDFMIVEGAGGILVPITKFKAQDSKFKVYFFSDLIIDLKLPVVIVARPTLGTINHTLLTVNYALQRGINVLGVIINYSRPPENDIAEKTNPDVLRELCLVHIIGTLPYLKEMNKDAIDNAALILSPSLTEAIQKIFTLP